MRLDVSENLLEKTDMNSTIVEEEINFLSANIKRDIGTLRDMGFDKKMINKVYILLNPPNIERAIDFLTEINGIYQHNFIQSTKPEEKSLCFICKRRRQFHLNNDSNNLLDDDVNNNIITRKSIEDEQDLSLDECEVCYENIKNAEKNFNTIPCGHLFCTNCWFNYLKSLITEASVEKIKCMNHGCNTIINEDFILNHINENPNLLTKYKRFKKRAEIIKDKKKRMCPNPDCDSFLKKSKKSKYVKCENGHYYCFDCLNPAHGRNPCDDPNGEIPFLNWLKGKKVKRCPRCQMYTEKNFGCNHMTCVSCKYQWCWLCLEEYKYGHYDSGKCEGKQFYEEENKQKNENQNDPIYPRNDRILIRNNECNFGLHKIFKCVYPNINRRIEIDVPLWLKYLSIIGFWLFGVPFLYLYIFVTFLSVKKNFNGDDRIISIFISFFMMIPYQILFTCSLSPFILVALIYHKFFETILMFFGVGEYRNNF